MKLSERTYALAVATRAARAAGRLMRRNLRAAKAISSETQHDIKLELDVVCQKRVERTLLWAFPESAVLGEEGTAGPANATLRWVVDPIDGTVNFTYGIPHACVSIALQVWTGPSPGRPGAPLGEAEFATVVAVVYDPFAEELWTAIQGQPARLNGTPIHVSKRDKLGEAVVSLGFGKKSAVLDQMLPAFAELVHRVRKIRIMGSAALALTYVASGRFDAFVEAGVRLWDIAAGGLILECAGGEFWRQPLAGDHYYALNGNNGVLRRSLDRFLPKLGEAA